MPLYTKPSKELVYDLINEANPGLDIPVSPTNVALGAPAIIPGVSWPNSNTTIVASPAAGSNDFIGKQSLNYRRLDLSALFRGQIIQIKKFKSTSGSVAGTLMYTVYQLLEDINQTYGMKLTQDDINDANIVRGNVQEDGQYTTTVAVTTKANSLGFTGQFSLKWVNTKQSIEDMITVSSLPGRIYPGGNDFTGVRAPILQPLSYGIDFSLTAKTYPWNGYPSSVSKTNQTPGNQFTAFLNPAMGVINDAFQTALKTNIAWGTEISNMTAAVVTSANAAAYPEVNLTDYSHCLVVGNCPIYGDGSLYFHYKP